MALSGEKGGMGLKPRPTPLDRELDLEEVDEHRFDGCEHYQDCLQRMAVKVGKRYGSWTCQKCPLFDTRSGGGYSGRP